jgi:hypothetical protein
MMPKSNLMRERKEKIKRLKERLISKNAISRDE